MFAQLVQWQVKPGHSSLRSVKAPESSPTIFLVTADPEARGDQWPRAPRVYRNWGSAGSVSSGGTDPPGPPLGRDDPPEPLRGNGDGMYAEGTDGSRRERGVPPGRRGRRAAAIIALILGLAGFAVSAFGVAI